jgi:hypothetical protein
MRTVLKGDTTLQRARAKIGKLCTKVLQQRLSNALRVTTGKRITNFRYETNK